MSPKKARIMAMTLAVILALAIVLGLIFSLVSPPAKAEGTLDALRKNAQSLAEAKEKLQKELDQLAGEQATAAQKKQALDKQIEITLTEIDNTSQLIAELTANIAVRQTALDEAMSDEARQLEEFRVRIRLMEEAGEAQYLGVLLESDSFADLLGRISTVQDIMEYDNKLLQTLKATRLRVNAEKTALEASKAEQEEVRQGLADRQSELEEQNAQQQALIREMESQADEIRKAIDEQDRLEKEVQDQIRREMEDIARRLAEQNKSNNYVGGDFLWPCPACTRVSSEFGMRFHPILKENRGHSGLDMAAPTGSKILAANAGTVITANYSAGGYGNYVVINHGGGRATLYGHMSKILVSVGQSVERGDIIGLVGSTGLSTGPHLHFEVIINGTPVNPREYL